MICVRLPCHLRQVMCHVASNHAPTCIKKRAVLRQVAIVLSYSCIAISPFRSSFPIFSAFYFPVSCFSIPIFFRCFLTKYVLKFSLSYYQMSLISSEICKGSIPNGNLPRSLPRRGVRAWSVFLGNKMNSFIS